MDKKKIALLMGIAWILVGCSYSKAHPPTEHNMACEDIEQKLTFSSSDADPEIDYSSPTKQAELYRQYKLYGCDVKQ